MLVRPDVKVVRALVTLKSSANWDTIRTYLAEERAKALEVLSESQDELTLRRMQGRAAVLKEFSELVSTSDQLLTKQEAPKRLSSF
jgi:hypothetical protein